MGGPNSFLIFFLFVPRFQPTRRWSENCRRHVHRTSGWSSILGINKIRVETLTFHNI